jgi:hypothetical protein
MNIDGMHVLSVIPPDHTVGIVFSLFFAIASIIFLCMTFQAIDDAMYGFAFVFGALTLFVAVCSYLLFDYYTPTHYKVTISDMSHFDYQHWKIVDQDGEILTVEKVNP